MDQGLMKNDTLSVNEKKHLKNEKLSERGIAKVLVHHLSNLDYQVITEFVLTDKLLNIKKLTKKKFSKIRIDVAALKNDKLLFIEVENGLWMTHPVQYRNFAHLTFLAYPAEANNLTDSEQLTIAEKFGIGVLKVSTIGTVSIVLKAIEHKMNSELEKTIIALFNKRLKKMKK